MEITVQQGLSQLQATLQQFSRCCGIIKSPADHHGGDGQDGILRTEGKDFSVFRQFLVHTFKKLCIGFSYPGISGNNICHQKSQWTRLFRLMEMRRA